MTGLELKFWLEKNELNQLWLRKQLYERKGVMCDASQICKALSGRDESPRAKKIISDSEAVLTDYERLFVGAVI